MSSKSFEQKWGSLTLDLQIKNRSALLFTLFFMVRRWVVAFVIVAFPRYNWLQVIIITNSNVLSIAYQGWFRPYEFPEINDKEIANEFFIQLNTYFLLTYTDYVNDPESKYTMGWVNIVCLAFMILFNLFLICRWQLNTLKRWLKLRNMKIKQT